MKTFTAFLIIAMLSFTRLFADTGFGVSEVGTLSSMSTNIKSNENLPLNYFLNQNYPNPFNPSTEIAFSLAKASFVTLEVFDALGQKVQVLINRKMNAGRHAVKFNAGNLASGVYYYKITADKFQQVKKMLLIQ